jgi:putative endonuclease
MHYVYIIKCSDGTLYSGYTTDVKRRVLEHNSGKKGAKYTRGRRPVSLCYKEVMKSESKAKKREAEIKKLTRKEKLKLIK